MNQRVLVASTVHHADDTRIRERLIRTLSQEFDVTYATSGPAPSDLSGLEWEQLAGGRLKRLIRALMTFATTNANIVSIHDPELIMVAWVARMRGIPVVFDLHERFPDQLAQKRWMPKFFAPLARVVAKLSLKFATFAYDITLAEAGYDDLFIHDYPVFENYPAVLDWPERSLPGDGSVIYVGGVTHQRGLDLAVQAAGEAKMPITLVGPVSANFLGVLEAIAATYNTQLTVKGRLPNAEALALVAKASVAVSPLRDIENYKNSLPTKVIEYASIGIPTVASDLPGTREVATGIASVLLVPAGSAEALKEGILAAAAQQDVGMDTIDMVRTKFRWPDQQVLDLYRNLAV